MPAPHGTATGRVAGAVTHLRTDLTVHHHGPPLGEAPLLVFLHGLTDSGTGWPEAVQHWSAEHTILAPDLRGHGTSPRFTPEELAGHPGEVMVSDAVTLLTELRDRLAERPTVVGHSLGGAVALTTAVRRPDLVAGLVLEDPAPLDPVQPVRDRAYGVPFLDGARRSLAATNDEALLQQRREDHPDWPETELLPTGRAEQQMDLDYLAGGSFKPITPWPDLLGALVVPTLVVSGDAMDQVCVHDPMEQALREAPAATFVRLPGAAHCARREQSEAYYGVVDGWLDERRPPRAGGR